MIKAFNVGLGSTRLISFRPFLMSSESAVKRVLTDQLQPEHLEVTDLSDGCGAKFNIVVASKLFEGKSLLDRHRMVNAALAEEMKTIHAVTMKTLTVDQWNAAAKQ